MAACSRSFGPLVLQQLPAERQPLVELHVVDAQFQALLPQRVGDLPVVGPPHRAVQLRLVELEADRIPLVLLPLHLVQRDARAVVERVHAATEHDAVRIGLGQRVVGPRGREPFLEPAHQRHRLGDGHVRVRLLEQDAVRLLRLDVLGVVVRVGDVALVREQLGRAPDRVDDIAAFLTQLVRGTVVEHVDDVVENEVIIIHFSVPHRVLLGWPTGPSGGYSGRCLGALRRVRPGRTAPGFGLQAMDCIAWGRSRDAPRHPSHRTLSRRCSVLFRSAGLDPTRRSDMFG